MKVDNKPEGGVKDPNIAKTTTTTTVGQRTNTSGNVNRANTGSNQRPNINNTNRTNTTGNTRINTTNSTTGNNTNTNKPVNTSTTSNTTGSTANKSGFRDNKKKGKPFEQISSKEIQGNIKSTLAKMGTNKGTGKSKRSKYNRSKDDNSDSEGGEIKLLKVTEFINTSSIG